MFGSWLKIALRCVLLAQMLHATYVLGDNPGVTSDGGSSMDGTLMKGVASFSNDKIGGKISMSLLTDQHDAKVQLWSMIYSKDGATSRTIHISVAEATSCPADGTATLTRLVTSFSVPNMQPETYQAPLDLVNQPNLLGEQTVLGKVLILLDGTVQIACARLNFAPTDDVKELIWTFPCPEAFQWADFDKAVKDSGLKESQLKLVPEGEHRDFMRQKDDRGCCSVKLAVLGSLSDADLENLYMAATEPGKIGKFSPSYVCKTDLMASHWGDRIKSIVQDFPGQPGQCQQSTAFVQWKQAFSAWQSKMKELYGERFFEGMSSGPWTQSYPGGYAWDVQQGYGSRQAAWEYWPQPANNVLDQLLAGFGFTSAKEKRARAQQSVESLQSAVWQLESGRDIRLVANDIVVTLYTENAWIRQGAEMRSLVGEILCRISNSPNKEEAISMIQQLIREMRENSDETLESVLDKMIRKSILSAIQSRKYGELVKDVFRDEMAQKLSTRFLEGLGLQGAGQGFTEFSVSIIVDTVKTQGKEMHDTVQNYIDQNKANVSMNTTHIFEAIRNLTGNFTHQVLDSLAMIIKNPDSVVTINKYIKHAIDDISKFDLNGAFTNDLKYLLGYDAKVPLEGLPLRLMIFLIQPDRESCNLESILPYVPQQPQQSNPTFWSSAGYSLGQSSSPYWRGRGEDGARRRQYGSWAPRIGRRAMPAGRWDWQDEQWWPQEDMYYGR